MADEPSITITANGPYLVRGGVELTIESIGVNEGGESSEWVPGRQFPAPEKYALCRCGQSSNKPFCDGTHAKVGFDGTETASRAPYVQQAKTYHGETYDLLDAGDLCAYARYCDRAGTIWKLLGSTADPEIASTVRHEAASCPSGRLVLRDKKTGGTLESELGASIGIVEDPSKACSGPLWVRGGIPVTSSDGTTYEVRNRVTLCRCGASKNKPFCDGSHDDVHFHDGLATEVE